MSQGKKQCLEWAFSLSEDDTCQYNELCKSCIFLFLPVELPDDDGGYPIQSRKTFLQRKTIDFYLVASKNRYVISGGIYDETIPVFFIHYWYLVLLPIKLLVELWLKYNKIL